MRLYRREISFAEEGGSIIAFHLNVIEGDQGRQDEVVHGKWGSRLFKRPKGKEWPDLDSFKDKKELEMAGAIEEVKK